MLRRLWISVVLSTCLLGTAHAQQDDLSSQIEGVAEFINSQEPYKLGGPSAAGIVADLDGQWFPLNTVVRNWGDAGVGYGPEGVERSIATHCEGDPKDVTFIEATGWDSFSVREVLGEYQTEFIQELKSNGGRRFSISFDDEALIRSYGKQDANSEEQGEILDMAVKLKALDVEFWRPSPDLLVSLGPFGLDVIGRCPTIP